MRFRRWVGSTISVVAASVIAPIAVGLQSPPMAFASSTHSASHAVLVASRTTTFPWKGHDPSCEVRLPIPLFVRYARFTTCPPKRVLVLGDSVAITMGIQMNFDQENWGAIVDVAAT